ncbi:MAG: hypothetical protein PHU27_04245 [Salinivirgaceae bacterium]|nr:hypothetical protein [Salinivirgaceae bacterium]MDD4745944.1 hypothetical protein [Salinivirgaceae bacterium]MDY0279752.1 hypothetical protein [Salinivirgaceae bacterium]
MRKLHLLLLALILTFSVIAQDEKPIEEKQYLPQAGSIAIGIDGGPIFDYLGNMFNGTINNGLNFNENTLYFRYYIADDAAIRAVLSINNSTNVNRFNIRDDAAFFADPLTGNELEDVQTIKNRDMMLRIGYQGFKGYKRLLGFYGADIGFRYERAKTAYEYGNQMTVLNPAPTTHWGSLATRDLELNNGAKKTISLGAFTGAEYYFMPGFCIGGEFGLSYGASFTGQTNSKEELIVGTVHVEREVAGNPGSRRTNLTTEFPYTYGSLYFMIHF